MICPRCSRQLPDGSKFCDGCGLALTNQAPTQAPTYQQPSPFPNAPQQYPYPQAPLVNQPVPGKGLGIASLILGILSVLGGCFLGFNLLLPITGLVLGIVGISQSKKVRMNNGMAVAGLVCSIVALLLNIVISIILVIIVVEETGSIEYVFEALPYLFEEILEEIF